MINQIDNAPQLDSSAIGRRILLPSSFTSSPRQMQQLYQDAMAIVQCCGKPDLFITFTCNPKWPEIQNELHASQCSTDRIDLVVRVFNQKQRALMNDIVKRGIFGRVVGYIYVVEFQKRGLPHSHNLFILHPSDKP